MPVQVSTSLWRHNIVTHLYASITRFNVYMQYNLFMMLTSAKFNVDMWVYIYIVLPLLSRYLFI
nr:hypothetical protein Q903MT_gene6530 [Picea sitchensis]